MHIIETRNLTYVYHGKTKALDNINFKVERGERVVLLGANGAGKSTLFKHFNGILKPTSGQVLIKGEPITKKNILEVRKTVGLVFQDPDDQIFSPTVKQDIAFGPMNLGLPKETIEHRVETALKLVGLEGLEDRVPHHLSGGQKKRVAIAGILAMEPQVMVLDEPTAGLDPDGIEKIIELINNLNKKYGITIILSTHEVDIVPEFADRVCVMAQGKIICERTPKRVFVNQKALRDLHLRLPKVTHLLSQLQEHGVPVGLELTVDGAREELLRVLN
ncbi:MAG: ATP-binding cassette domain-containing protein [Methanosarcinales archaeon]